MASMSSARTVIAILVFGCAVNGAALANHLSPPVSVALVGSLQSELGCPGDWQPECADTELAFDDELLGGQVANLAHDPGDFIVRRKDGIFAYQLASVVDDGELGVTDVVRGADLLDSTARQIALFRALDYPLPRFWHVPLMVDHTGRKMGKRDGSDLLRSLPKKSKEDRFGSGRIFGTYLRVASEGTLRVGETLKVAHRVTR